MADNKRVETQAEKGKAPASKAETPREQVYHVLHQTGGHAAGARVTRAQIDKDATEDDLRRLLRNGALRPLTSEEMEAHYTTLARADAGLGYESTGLQENITLSQPTLPHLRGTVEAGPLDASTPLATVPVRVQEGMLVSGERSAMLMGEEEAVAEQARLTEAASHGPVEVTQAPPSGRNAAADKAEKEAFWAETDKKLAEQEKGKPEAASRSLKAVDDEDKGKRAAKR